MKNSPTGSPSARLGLALVALIVACTLGCAPSPRAPGTVHGREARRADAARVVAHSSGIVSVASPLRVVFASEFGAEGRMAPSGLVRTWPAVEGRATWEDGRTLAWLPAKPLERGRRYRADVDLGLLSGKAAGDDYFSMEIMPAAQVVSVDTKMPRSGPRGWELEGTLRLSDTADPNLVERAFRSSVGSVAWKHASSREHGFVVSGIPLKGSPKVTLSWKGKPVGARGSGSSSVGIPQAGFAFVGARVVPGTPDRPGDGGSPIELAFSRPLDGRQDLRGLISVAGVADLRTSLRGSTVTLYAGRWPDSALIQIEPGLAAEDGSRLMTPVAATVAVGWEKPRSRWLSQGVILPTSQGSVLALETMNLAGIVVEALEVRGDNMLQFLQANGIDGNSEMSRVGEVIWRRTIDLGWKPDWKNRWVRQGLDLGPLVSAKREGMVQIRVSFVHDQIRYVPAEAQDWSSLKFPESPIMDPDSGNYSYWDYAETWADSEDSEAFKNEPDHPAYYLPSYDHDIAIRRNVVVSDIGAAIKRDAEGAWHVAVSDLRSARPLEAARVSLYSFQRRLLATATTPVSGIVVIDAAAIGKAGQAEGAAAAEPAFALVSSASQSSWLKVDSGSTLAVGHFDVGGDRADAGLKGYIYGERGVWRPGDEMKLVFILSDRSGALPERYPVTWQLEDPRGSSTQTGTVPESLGGFYAIGASTSPDAPTGTWTLRVRAGGRSFTKSLRVETIMPNRLKLALDWGGGTALSRDTGNMALSATWLTGAAAGAYKADVSATFRSAKTSFASFGEYSFDDPTRELPGGRAVLFKGSLGEGGKTSFKVDLAQEALAPGLLKADILSRVFEPTGIFSSESTTVDFHPYGRYVGVKLPRGDAARGMLLTDKDQRVDLVLVDREGRPARGRIGLSLYQLEWRWWWEKSDESLAQRAEELYANPLQKGTVTTGADGRASWTFQVKYPAWGRFLVRAVDLDASASRTATSGGAVSGESRGHASGAIAYVDWPGWAGRNRDQGGAAATLELSAGKPKFSPGERASFSFPSNAEAEALVTIERSGSILREEWIRASGETTLYEFPVTADMAPTVYAHVTLVQPHLQTANDLPIRLYGVLPIAVEDPQTRLRPTIEAPTSIAPGSEVSFKVREAGGRPMTYTVAVVDEGLLGITRFATADPWEAFYRKEASALRSFDLYDSVAGAYAGSLETLLAVGGSEEGLDGGSRKPSRFPPVVRFLGPFRLAAGETAEKSFTIGNYIGALRLMVVAGALPQGGFRAPGGPAFGTAELSLPVRSDLMALITAPRALAPGETASVPVTVFSFGGARRVEVELKAEGSLAVQGSARATVNFGADGDKAATFTVAASGKPGQARLSVVASSATAGSAYRRATASVALEVRDTGVTVNRVTEAAIEAGRSWSGTIKLPGQAGANSVTLELSRLRTLALSDRLDWLIQYPHGCAEQTISAAFPQLYLPGLLQLSPETGKASTDNVARAIARLRVFQTPRGGFSLWPGQEQEDDWVSAYAVNFLLASRQLGFAVPEASLGAALGALARTARNWSSTEGPSQDSQAYRLYDLALAGQAEIPAMNRLRDAQSMPVAARWRLAATYCLAGMRAAGEDLVKGQFTEPVDFPGLAAKTFGTPLRERAIILDAARIIGDGPRAISLYNQVAGELSSSRWLSTQDIGAALAAALPYALLASQGESPELRLREGSATATTIRLDRVMERITLAPSPGSETSLSLENLGSSPVFARIIATGVPAQGVERAISNGLLLSIRYLDMEGSSVDPANIPAGSDMIVEATVRNRSGQELRNLALSQLFPSGWEFVNLRPGKELPSEEAPEDRDTGRAAALGREVWDYRDSRDDRVLTYFALGATETKVFTSYVNRSYGGNFWLPASSVSAMYDARWQALVPGRWLRSGTGTP